MVVNIAKMGGAGSAVIKNVGTFPHKRAIVVIPKASPGFEGNTDAIAHSVTDIFMLNNMIPIK